MEEIVGILNKAEEKAFGKKLDGLIDFNKFATKGWMKWVMRIIELKDDDLFTAGIMYLDNRFGDMIPVNYKENARKLALAVLNEDATEFKKVAPELINQMVDIPKMDEETEGIIIAALIIGIVNALEVKYFKE